MMEKEILEKGYKEYKKSPFDNNGIEKKYQKCISDDKGKRYFINISQWEEMKHPHTGEVFPVSYEYDVQFYKKGTHEPINMLFFAGWKLDDVEEQLEKMFETGLFDYYELYDGTRKGQ